MMLALLQRLRERIDDDTMDVISLVPHNIHLNLAMFQHMLQLHSRTHQRALAY